MDRLAHKLPPIRGMLAFEAVARCGSFTEAAQELNVSQPAVSRQVRLLEEALGVELFRREHRRIVLTEAGRSYREAIVAGFGAILAAGERISQVASSERVTIYSYYGLASYWLMPRLARFQQANPNIEIAVSTVEDEQRLSDSESEIAIRFGDGRWRDGISKLLFPETGFPVCSPAYLESAAPIESVSDLKHHRLLHVRAHSQPWLDWTALLKALKAGFRADSGPSFNNYTLAIQAALAGQGVAIGWQGIIDDFLARGWLVKPLDAEITTEYGYYTVIRPMAASSDNLNTVLAWLHQ